MRDFDPRVRLNPWPRRGPVKRIYINTGGRWSVETWLEHSSCHPGWKLAFKMNDVEAFERRIEIMTTIESYVFEELTALLHQIGIARSCHDVCWDELIALAGKNHRLPNSR